MATTITTTTASTTSPRGATDHRLVTLAPGLHAVEGSFRAPGGVRFPVRSTIVSTPRGVVVIAPIDFDEPTARAVDTLGEVSLIVAPNRFHHAYVAAAQARWPKARTLGAPGLADKRPDLRFDGTLADAELIPGLRAYAIDGAPKASEHVLLHAPTRTLIVTDLVFHIRRAPNVMSWIVFKLIARTLGHLRMSRLWRYLRQDRGAFEASLVRVLALDFDRLVVAHGDVVEEGGRDALAEGVAWILGRAR
ncbi:MAG: hypothetical protein KF901_17260 [Myxococcales bacterium]|nr:hypothetical protein [Myxococcales bacterium]